MNIDRINVDFVKEYNGHIVALATKVDQIDFDFVKEYNGQYGLYQIV
jgi:hypothetical protein